ncbi:MAG: hypothetical protein RJA57_1125, partial [Bacteroidota bacterium]
MSRSIRTCVALLLVQHALAQAPTLRIELLHEGTGISLRGLSVANDNVAWVSGSKGTVGRTTNGGKTWNWWVVKGFESTDFRDIEAFDARTALIMGVGAPAYILRTIDGGESWTVVYENRDKRMFLDAMEFWNEQSGIVLGDPVDGRFFVARTFDGGRSWRDSPLEDRPRADSGEACFAASGTNVRSLDRDQAVFVSGGRRSRLFIRDQTIDLPILQGGESTGANSVAVWDNLKREGGKRMIVVGGDFNRDSSTRLNCFFTDNGGRNWRTPQVPPGGYRSCVEYFSRNEAFACGPSGVDRTIDGGKIWTPVSATGFHVVRTSKLGAAVYFAGA